MSNDCSLRSFENAHCKRYKSKSSRVHDDIESAIKQAKSLVTSRSAMAIVQFDGNRLKVVTKRYCVKAGINPMATFGERKKTLFNPRIKNESDKSKFTKNGNDL